MPDRVHRARLGRRALIGGALGAGGAGAGWALAHGRTAPPRPSSDGLALVRGGEPLAAVVLEDSADEQLRHAAATLVDHVERATGARLPVWPQPDGAAPGPAFTSRILLRTDPERTDESGDGYRVDVGEKEVDISARTAWGTRYGVYELLERFVGVRWLMPGPAGTHVPQSPDLTVPLGSFADAPAFHSRMLSPLFNDARSDSSTDTDPVLRWAAHARLHWSIDFHHNLGAIFPVATHADPSSTDYEPGLYAPGTAPARGVPTADGWQPNLGNSKTIEMAARAAISHVDRTGSRSFSLGMNDNGGFGADVLDARPNSVNKPSASQAYYRWVNAVVDRFLELRPDLKDCAFGVLAYAEVFDPPGFALRPQVVPFVCRDQYGRVSTEVDDENNRLLERWAGRTTDLGLYDYAYGQPYVIPRLALEATARGYRSAAAAGVKYIHAELYPDWGEGPKPWVMSKLMWNPQLEVRALEEEWCEAAAGAAGAQALHAYFDTWRDAWAQDVPRTGWFAQGRGREFFLPRDSSYLDALSPAKVSDAAKLLDSALDSAVTKPQAERVGRLRVGLDYYLASVESYPRSFARPRSAAQARTQAAALAATTDLRTRQAQARSKAASAMSEADLVRPGPRNEVAWTGVNGDLWWNVLGYLRENSAAAPALLAELQQARSRSDATVSARVVDLLTRVHAQAPAADPLTIIGLGDVSAHGIIGPHVVVPAAGGLSVSNVRSASWRQRTARGSATVFAARAVAQTERTVGDAGQARLTLRVSLIDSSSGTTTILRQRQIGVDLSQSIRTDLNVVENLGDVHGVGEGSVAGDTIELMLQLADVPAGSVVVLSGLETWTDGSA